MTINAEFWRKLSSAILWACISALLLLFPVMVYQLQPGFDIKEERLRSEIQQQKNILSRLRAETSLLTSGYQDNPREEILRLLDELYDSVYIIDLKMERVTEEMQPIARSWERYARSLYQVQEAVLDVSSASALYDLSVTQLEDVFHQAEQDIQQSDLPGTLKDRYNLHMVRMTLLALRYAALPSDAAAMRLEYELNQIRIDAGTLPSVDAQRALDRTVRYTDGLIQAASRIQDTAQVLMDLPTYQHLDSFDSRFQQWLTQEQLKQRQSRWTLLLAVVLLVGAIIVALLRLKLTQERLLSVNSSLSAYKKAIDEHAIVSITDPRGRIQFVNRKFVEVSGYEEQELIGQTHRKVNSGVHPKGFFRELWEHVNRGDVWHNQVCNRRKDGSLYWVNATVVPMLDQENQVESIISVRTDITDIKHAQRALTAEKERAEVANKAKSDFLANMSHEIRTPMNAVIGMSHLAHQTCRDEQVSGYIEKIQYSARNLLAIINDILDFSKIEAGRLDIEQIPFRLDNVINHMQDLARVRADEKGLPMRIEISPDVPNELEGDPLRLGQVLLNLVNNAIKFTEDGEVRISVDLLDTAQEHVRLRFSVTDTGIGLSQEQMGRLFQSFSQADTSTTRQYGGTGLGLAISKQLVELMQGEIGVHSVAGEGSEFFFTVNLRHHESAEHHREIDLKQVRVLAIDDDNTTLSAIREQLQAQGITVDTEGDSPAGLNRLVNAYDMDAAPYDLLLIDWQMPVMDGFDVAKAVRNNSALPEQPAIIMLTAHAGEDLQRRINHNLIDSVLLKPVTGSHLLNAMQEALAKRQKTASGPTIRTLFREGDEINALLGARVLIAEDNLINQEVITGLLEPFGLDLRLAANGREAVDALQQESFDLVFMDIQMPELDGIRATEQILQMQLPKTPPIIAMTAHAQSDDIALCLDIGMQDHIAKPVDPAELKEKLVRWIEPRVISGYIPDAEPAPSVEGALPCQIEGVNLKQALYSMGGNRSLLKKMMQQFCQDYAEGTAPVRALLAEGDWKSVQRWLHTLKGTSATLGMEALTGYSETLERMQFDQRLPSDQDLEPLAQELERVIRALQACIRQEEIRSDNDAVPGETDKAFAASLQPQFSKESQREVYARLLPQIRTQLEEGDPEVLDLLPDLLELFQMDEKQMALVIRLMEHAEVYEFDEALVLLDQLHL